METIKPDFNLLEESLRLADALKELGLQPKQYELATPMTGHKPIQIVEKHSVITLPINHIH